MKWPASMIATRLVGSLAAWRRCRPEPELRRSGVGKRLDDAPSQGPLEVAVDVESQRLEPGGLRLLLGTPEHLEEIGQGGRKLAVGGQRHSVDVGLRPRDRVVVEAREAQG